VDLDLGSAVRQAAADELALDVPLPEPHVLKHGRHCGLTPHELEILLLIVDGRSSREIATLLNLSDNTVGVHRANMMSELGLHKTAELVVYAIRNTLVSIP
jgi:DNA-binding NarL/FixJ family response regulator